MFRLWIRLRRIVFIILMLAVCGWGVWEWYASVSAFSWTEEQKNAYINQKLRLVTLQEKMFTEVLENLDEQTRRFSEDIPARRNLFIPLPEKK